MEIGTEGAALATWQQIADWLEIEGEGPIKASVQRVSAPDSATTDSLVFATSVAALEQALGSCAGMILVNATLSPACEDRRILRVPDARLAFAVIAERLQIPHGSTIDPSATVSATASVGEGTAIGPGAVLEDGVRIGRSCSIGARAVIEAGVQIGDRVRVQAGAVLGSLGFGYARRKNGSYLLFPQQGTLVIEDDVEIGANTTIDRGALGETRIGEGTKIDNLVHIGHNCRIGRNVIIAAQTGISGSSMVEDGAILGGQVGIGERALVGPGVILGGGAGVLSGKKLRGPGQVFWGRPARPLKQYLHDLARLSRGK